MPKIKKNACLNSKQKQKNSKNILTKQRNIRIVILIWDFVIWVPWSACVCVQEENGGGGIFDCRPDREFRIWTS